MRDCRPHCPSVLPYRAAIIPRCRMTTLCERLCGTSGTCSPREIDGAAGGADVARLGGHRRPASATLPGWSSRAARQPRRGRAGRGRAPARAAASRPASRCAPSAGALTALTPAGALGRAAPRARPAARRRRPGRPAVVGGPAGRRAPGAAGFPPPGPAPVAAARPRRTSSGRGAMAARRRRRRGERDDPADRHRPADVRGTARRPGARDASWWTRTPGGPACSTAVPAAPARWSTTWPRRSSTPGGAGRTPPSCSTATWRPARSARDELDAALPVLLRLRVGGAGRPVPPVRG